MMYDENKENNNINSNTKKEAFEEQEPWKALHEEIPYENSKPHSPNDTDTIYKEQIERQEQLQREERFRREREIRQQEDRIRQEQETRRREQQARIRQEQEEKQQQETHFYKSQGHECGYHEKVKEPVKKQNNKKGWAKFIAACLIISIVGGGTMGTSLGITQKYLSLNKVNQEDTSITMTPVKSGVSKVSGNSVVDIIKEVKPSVVSISTKLQTQSVYFGGFNIGSREAQGAGSGVVFYSDDEKIGIATNNHVIEGAKQIVVTFEEDKDVPAEVVGTDSTSDLAVIAVKQSDLKEAGVTSIHVATFGDSDQLEVGESVIAIGNALGEGLTVTDGIISATGKTINVDGKELQVIQTNAAINEGNSGGALVNSAGEVIGINTAKAFENMAEGMGYAIPSSVFSPIVEKLLKEGTPPKPYIGIQGEDINNDVAQLYKLPVGVLVVNVLPGGSAENAGIMSGDIITEFAGEKVMSMDRLVEILSKQQVDATVKVHIIRDGSTPMDLSVKILDANKMN